MQETPRPMSHHQTESRIFYETEIVSLLAAHSHVPCGCVVAAHPSGGQERPPGHPIMSTLVSLWNN